MGGTIVRCDRPADQVSRSLISLPGSYVNQFIRALDYAEDKLGEPPTILQVFDNMSDSNQGKLNMNQYQLAACIFSLMREDILFTEPNCYKFTSRRKEGFYSYSEIFRMKYREGYYVARNGRVYPSTARTVNFNQLMTILKSTDESLMTENEWIWDGDFRFLDGQSYGDNKVQFTSFPRSGNSFLRRTLESVSGITTGSSISMHTSTSLQVQGMKGEGHIDDSVWIIKSHHPFLLQDCSFFKSDKTIFCMRHPLDVFPSYASLMNTMNHGTKPEYEYERDYAEWWDWFVRKQTRAMRRFFEIVIRHYVNEKKNPIYFVRYEDLVTQPEDTLKGLFSFLLDKPDLEGTNVERRIRHVNAQGTKATQSYALKSTTGKFNTHSHRYTESQIAYMKEQLADVLYFFGYANTEDNETGFFEYEEHSPELLAKSYKFREVNQEQIAEMANADRVKTKYQVNTDEAFDLLDEEDFELVQYPSMDYGRRQMMVSKAKKACGL